MFRFYGLLALAAFFVICMSVLIGSLFSEKKRRHQIISAFEAAYDDRGDAHKPEVKEMVALYLTMVAKHGPESEEARAFRFGTDSHLMQRLHADDASMAMFNEQADVVDDVCRRIAKKRRGWLPGRKS